MGGDPNDGMSSLAADVRNQDPDRYLATLFAPAEVREALFALYAFDHEIAKVRRLVREPMAGLVRLQWWRDALDGIEAGDVLAHPVVVGLSQAITERGLDRGFLDGAIEARERELEEEPPDAIAAFERHLQAANGGIARAAVSMLGGHDSKVLSMADRLGLTLGLLEKLRLLEAARGELPLWLPKPFLVEHGLADQGSEHPRDDEGRTAKMEGLRRKLARMAREQLALARKDQASIKRPFLTVFFPGTLAEIRLRDLDRSGNHPAIAAAPFRLCWHWLRGRF